MLRKLLIAALLVAALGFGLQALLSTPPVARTTPELELPIAEPNPATGTLSNDSSEESPRRNVRPDELVQTSATQEIAGDEVNAAGIEVELFSVLKKAGTPHNVGRPEQIAPNIRLRIGLGDAHTNLQATGVEVVTGADGSIRVRLPFDIQFTTHSYLVTEVIEPGRFPDRVYTNVEWILDSPKKSQGPRKIQVLAVPGTSVSGQLFGPDGKATPGLITLFHHDKSAVTPWRIKTKATAGRDGLFRAAIKGEGEWRIVARATESERQVGKGFSNLQYTKGTGATESFPVSFKKQAVGLVVQTKAPGTLRGRVTDASGAPSANLELVVLVAEFDEEGDPNPGNEFSPSTLPSANSSAAQNRANELIFQGRGLARAFPTTDSDGRFEVLGLRLDNFVIRAKKHSSHRSYEALLTPVPVLSDGSLLALTVARPHVVVRVQNQDGSPFRGDIFPEARSRYNTDSIFAVPVLTVMHSTKDSSRSDLDGVFLKGKSGAPGEFIFDVLENANLLIGVHGGGVLWKPTELFVPAGSGRIDVAITVSKVAPMGLVSLEVFSPNSEPIIDNLSIKVYPLTEGPSLFGRSSFYSFGGGSGWPLPIDLPEGDWRLVVTSIAYHDSHHGTLLTPRKYGSFESLIRVFEGTETSIRATLTEGARVHLNLAGEVLEEDLLGSLAKHGDQGEFNNSFFPKFASVTMCEEGKWPTGVPFIEGGDKGWRYGGGASARLTMGTERTSQVLTPGRYTLTARMLGGREVSKEVVLVPGETLDVTMTFD